MYLLNELFYCFTIFNCSGIFFVFLFTRHIFKHCFITQAISILIRHVTTYRIEVEQLRVLLTYAEQALFDSKQQGIAFGVLKAILKKKLTLDELPDVMLKVAELVIKAEAVPVRLQSRKVTIFDSSLFRAKLINFQYF